MFAVSMFRLLLLLLSTYVLQPCLTTDTNAKSYQLYFLQQFGYRRTALEVPNSNLMKEYLEGGSVGSSDELLGELNQDELSTQIKEMQLYADIPQTGVFDEATDKMIRTPRCENPDVIASDNPISEYFLKTIRFPVLDAKLPELGYSRRKRGFSGRKWDLNKDRTLTYAFENITTKNDAAKQIIARAFEAWSECANINFRSSDNIDSANFLIKFASREHGPPQGDTFDGEGGVLAHAWYPPTGLVHFDEDENWKDSCYLYSVALHEIGHALGLSHSISRSSIMFAYFDPKYNSCNENDERQLSTADKRDIRELYGFRKCGSGSKAEDDENPTEFDSLVEQQTTTSPLRTTYTNTGTFNPPTTAYSTMPPIGCGEIMDNILQSPLYPDYYPNAVTCTWNLSAEQDGAHFQIYFLDFNLEGPSKKGECVYDYLRISYEVEGKTEEKKFCGKNDSDITIPASNIQIDFVSDNLKQYRGFKILFMTQQTPQCVERFTTSDNSIAYPRNTYPNFSNETKNCEIIIEPEFEEESQPEILLVFEHVRHKYNGDCELSKPLKIFDGNGTEIYVDLCTAKKHIRHVRINSKKARLLYNNNPNSQLSFLLRYYAKDGRNECDETSTGIGHWRTPLGVNSKYLPNTTCIVYNSNKHNDSLSIKVQPMKIERDKYCSYDFLDVYTVERGRIRLCGNLEKWELETDYEFLIIFKSDGNVEDSGGLILMDIKGCDVEIDKPNGFITSPKFPSKYSPKLNCVYRFPPNKYYSVCFEKFDVTGDCKLLNDHVNIEYETDTRLMLCNQNPPNSYTIGERIEKISFFSNDDDVQGVGFNMTYREEWEPEKGRECIRSFNQNHIRKQIKYTKKSSKETTCKTSFTVAQPYRIQLQIAPMLHGDIVSEKIEIYEEGCLPTYIINKIGKKYKLAMQGNSNTRIFDKRISLVSKRNSLLVIHRSRRRKSSITFRFDKVF